MLSPGNNPVGWKSLLTETLPYEVPVIFSNENFFASLASVKIDSKVEATLKKVRLRNSSHSIPYNYRISKGKGSATTLSIIHPVHQMEIAEFYENYKQSMLDYCNRSEMSLRHPVSETQMYAQIGNQTKDTLKLGIPHVGSDDSQIELSHLASYFTYRKYNLLGKFIESAEFRRLEKRYSLMRKLDVSRCFFNIYTHSITWAAKDKSFAKEQKDTYSFEARFDKLMQRTNYNETNGIVVGPECSRIFAEIIFQDIDRQVANQLAPLEHERDYSIRRYVDDYFVFARDQPMLDKIARVIERELEKYKLFINSNKTKTSSRPFVSDISLARSELKQLIDYMRDCVQGVISSTDGSEIKRAAGKLRRRVLDIRLICSARSVEFSSLSGWLLSVVRRQLTDLCEAISSSADDEKRDALLEMAASLLEVAFYICALDVRVRSTYSICQIVSVVQGLNNDGAREDYDRLAHLMTSELNDIIRSQTYENSAGDEDVDGNIELYNLLITGAEYLGADFLKTGYAADYLGELASAKPTRYFSYITCKFCFLKDSAMFANELAGMNAAVHAKLVDSKSSIMTDSELYLLFCDYLSAPDVSKKDKMDLINEIFGGSISKNDAEEVGEHVGFVDWRGVRITHLLRRKTLKPVYAWA
ncbi:MULTISPECIES: antiviral reverse transcriptase Drt3b [Hyphomonas]|uniref:antiviral reverse transcriptase Drt3b n=1 Tax=Hyphomonas TaxID=85 RepID=UPI003517D748